MDLEKWWVFENNHDKIVKKKLMKEENTQIEKLGVKCLCYPDYASPYTQDDTRSHQGLDLSASLEGRSPVTNQRNSDIQLPYIFT